MLGKKFEKNFLVLLKLVRRLHENTGGRFSSAAVILVSYLIHMIQVNSS